MKLIIIAALTKDRVISRNGSIPWRIAEDLHRFRDLTTGHAILMGRKTFESLGKALPNRRNVVLSSRQVPGVETYRSVKEALTALEAEERVFVIGGGTVFAELLDAADEMFLTIVDQKVEGDTFFPEYEHLIGSVFRMEDREDRHGHTFEHYVRMGKQLK